MKALTAVAAVLSVLALAAALAVGFKVFRPEAGGESDPPATAPDLEALAARLDGRLAGLEGSLTELRTKTEELVANPGGGEVDARAIMPLLKHMDPAVRRAAVEVLKGLQDPVCVPALKEAARKDVDATVRSAAFSAIGLLGGAEAAAFFRESLASTNSDVRRQAADQLKLLKDPEAFEPLAALCEREIKLLRPARPGYSASTPPELYSVLRAMAAIDPGKSLPYLLRTMAAQPSNNSLRSILTEVATAADVPVLVEFAGKLPPADKSGSHYSSSGTSGAHYTMIQLFARLGDKRAVPYLVSQLSSPNDSMRQTAAQTLVRVDREGAFEPLAEALRRLLKEEKKKDPNAYYRAASALISRLQETRDKRACAVFVDVAVASRDKNTRVYAVQALYACVDPKQGPRIYEMWKKAKEPEFKQRVEAVLKGARGYGYIWNEEAKDFTPPPPVEPEDVF